MRHLPNLLTLLRLLLTLPIAWLLLSERFAAALWLFAVAGASDALDGFLARRFGWVSRVGSVLDPLADKLLLVTSYVCLGLSQVLPWWLTLLVLLLAICVDLAPGLAHRIWRDLHDSARRDNHIRAVARHPGAVDDVAAADQQVVHVR